MNKLEEYEEMLKSYIEIYNTKRNSCTDSILEELRERIFDFSITYKMSITEIIKPQLKTGIYKLPVFDEGFKDLVTELIEKTCWRCY
jgi:hypothetical protein